jgi:hypothetical protein
MSHGWQRRKSYQCTSCPAEHENSSIKWGEMVVNPQQHMHQAVHTINKKFNSRFTVKEGHDAKNLDATQNWSATKANEFISKCAEGMIAFQWSRLLRLVSSAGEPVSGIYPSSHMGPLIGPDGSRFPIPLHLARAPGPIHLVAVKKKLIVRCC